MNPDLSLLIDIGMVDLGVEGDLGRFEGVISGKIDRHAEGSLAVRLLVLQ